jgi:RNA polymerase sigma-70 factor (ECF subfamily)
VGTTLLTATAGEQVATQTLVERAQRGDSQAFGQLYDQFVSRLYSYFYHQVQGQSVVAEDLTEEVFVKVIEKLNQYQDRGLPFAAWVFRIARNHLIDYRRCQPKASMALIDECDQVPEERAERSLELVLTRSELANAMSCLTEVQRQVLGLRFGQGMSMLEASQIIGRSEDAVKKLQARGLQALKRALDSSRQAPAVFAPS